MTYLHAIEPRLTPHRDVAPQSAADVLMETLADLQEETIARLSMMDAEDLAWVPHPDANSIDVTCWHIGRWLDFLGTRAFSGAGAEAELWLTGGWLEATGYDPRGIGWLGLGTLTGYSADEMRDVPKMGVELLSSYLNQACASLADQIGQVRDNLFTRDPLTQLSPYQAVSTTLQGSFGHLGEIDALVALRARIG